MIFVIDRRDSTLHYQAGVLQLQRKGKKPQQVPINQLEQVVVYGNPLVETSAWRALAEAGVPVIMLAVRGKPQVAMLGSGLATQLPLRKMQHRLAADPTTQLKMAKWFVRCKFRGYSLTLQTFTTLYNTGKADCHEFENIVRQAYSRIRNAENPASVLGVEG